MPLVAWLQNLQPVSVQRPGGGDGRAGWYDNAVDHVRVVRTFDLSAHALSDLDDEHVLRLRVAICLAAHDAEVTDGRARYELRKGLAAHESGRSVDTAAFARTRQLAAHDEDVAHESGRLVELSAPPEVDLSREAASFELLAHPAEPPPAVVTHPQQETRARVQRQRTTEMEAAIGFAEEFHRWHNASPRRSAGTRKR
jgi:hypothetical protein